MNSRLLKCTWYGDECLADYTNGDVYIYSNKSSKDGAKPYDTTNLLNSGFKYSWIVRVSNFEDLIKSKIIVLSTEKKFSKYELWAY